MATGPFTLVPSGAVTASGDSGALSLGPAPTINLQVTVTAVSGTTPSLALSVTWSNDGANFGAPDGGGDTFTAITAAGTVVKQLTVKGLYAKVAWAVTGTAGPSFTFEVVSS